MTNSQIDEVTLDIGSRSDQFIADIESRSPEWFVVPGDGSGCHRRRAVHLGNGWYAFPNRGCRGGDEVR